MFNVLEIRPLHVVTDCNFGCWEGLLFVMLDVVVYSYYFLPFSFFNLCV